MFAGKDTLGAMFLQEKKRAIRVLCRKLRDFAKTRRKGREKQKASQETLILAHFMILA
jgi:hypothetical protein